MWSHIYSECAKLGHLPLVKISNSINFSNLKRTNTNKYAFERVMKSGKNEEENKKCGESFEI